MASYFLSIPFSPFVQSICLPPLDGLNPNAHMKDRYYSCSRRYAPIASDVIFPSFSLSVTYRRGVCPSGLLPPSWRYRPSLFRWSVLEIERGLVVAMKLRDGSRQTSDSVSVERRYVSDCGTVRSPLFASCLDRSRKQCSPRGPLLYSTVP